jgi:hypothetical protein
VSYIPYFSKHTKSDRYEHVTLRAALRADPHYRDCRTQGCLGGHIQIPDEDGTLFICRLCKKSFCIKHNTDHSGESCRAYERRTARKRAEDKASEDIIKVSSTRCPMCKVPIHKTHGCDHMTCKSFSPFPQMPAEVRYRYQLRIRILLYLWRRLQSYSSPRQQRTPSYM